MSELNFPFLTANVIVPLVGAAGLSLTRSEAQARVLAIAATAGSALLSLGAVREVAIAGGIHLAGTWASAWFATNGLNAVPMALFAFLALATVIVAPRADVTRRMLGGILALLAATLASYAAQNLAVLLAGWLGSVLAFMLGSRASGERMEDAPSRALSNALLVAGVASLVISVLLIGMAAPLSIGNPAGLESAAGPWAFFFLILALVLRNGIFPAHSAAINLIERGPLLLSALFLNAQLGAFLFASIAVPMFPERVSALLPLLSGVALFTAIYTAVLGVIEKRPRRLLGIVLVSESANILAGLATSSAEDHRSAGALDRAGGFDHHSDFRLSVGGSAGG